MGKPSTPTADATSPAAQSCVKSTGDGHPELRQRGRGAGLQNSLPSQHGGCVCETKRLWLIPETETPFFTKVFYFSKQNTGSFKSIKSSYNFKLTLQVGSSSSDTSFHNCLLFLLSGNPLRLTFKLQILERKTKRTSMKYLNVLLAWH